MLYSTYSNAKVWAGQFDSDAEVALEHVIEATEPDEGGTVESKAYGTYLLSAKINLIQVLMQRGKPETDYREYAFHSLFTSVNGDITWTQVRGLGREIPGR